LYKKNQPITSHLSIEKKKINLTRKDLNEQNVHLQIGDNFTSKNQIKLILPSLFIPFQPKEKELDAQ